MTNTFDLDALINLDAESGQYEKQLQRIDEKGHQTDCIEESVQGALSNLSAGHKSFVIYGQPQSGKTEMMICLTAKLLDNGYRFIIHLINDNRDLRDQNLLRFTKSDLSPVPKNHKTFLDADLGGPDSQHIVFCKKNSGNLKELIEKIGSMESVIVIDDEADYASPNPKINKGTETPIHSLIKEILGDNGVYIGVTATPARLDLNNTFLNDNEHWVEFRPHDHYKGQDVFFPIDSVPNEFRLTPLEDHADEEDSLRQAIFGFLVTVAYLNAHHSGPDQNYSMLIHTSAKKDDHQISYESVREVLAVLSDPTHADFASYYGDIFNIAEDRYVDADAMELTKYIKRNIPKSEVLVLNSKKDRDAKAESATTPDYRFTFVIGGNIVSRGVTFNNLACMFFTRTVRGKMQQDTYIQRARMFGDRGSYLKHFELVIPDQLYADWHRCFFYHQLAIECVREGSPVWFADSRSTPVSSVSIDRSTVDSFGTEMRFSLFDYNPAIDDVIKSGGSSLEVLEALRDELGSDVLPNFIHRLILNVSFRGPDSLAIHPSSSIEGYKDKEGQVRKADVWRRRGFFGDSALQEKKYPHAVHHLKIFYNAASKARMVYRYTGSIQVLKNMRKAAAE